MDFLWEAIKTKVEFTNWEYSIDYKGEIDRKISVCDTFGNITGLVATKIRALGASVN